MTNPHPIEPHHAVSCASAQNKRDSNSDRAAWEDVSAVAEDQLLPLLKSAMQAAEAKEKEMQAQYATEAPPLEKKTSTTLTLVAYHPPSGRLELNWRGDSPGYLVLFDKNKTFAAKITADPEVLPPKAKGGVGNSLHPLHTQHFASAAKTKFVQPLGEYICDEIRRRTGYPARLEQMGGVLVLGSDGLINAFGSAHNFASAVKEAVKGHPDDPAEALVQAAVAAAKTADNITAMVLPLSGKGPSIAMMVADGYQVRGESSAQAAMDVVQAHWREVQRQALQAGVETQIPDATSLSVRSAKVQRRSPPEPPR